MDERTQRWNTKRYIADSETLLVHDRWTGLCDESTLLEIVRR